MIYQEALDIVPGASVLFRGRLVEVLAIERRGPGSLYFRLTEVAEPQHFASLYAVPDPLRLLFMNRLSKRPARVH
jgi:hypothetical protein